ncbi:GtrA family protein [Clostridium diolis]|uniref:Membrane protein, GtrA family n=2 Tax=Clostridium diolis TaxID=223919 RepID=A0AAV3VY61_9CLOT|nr:GtrA family protein [Clostridium diolis]QES75753.1 GtrA family protein [Clostridium diolis]GEA30421.1 membrane protein, GtrA family [Clostridium diolis]
MMDRLILFTTKFVNRETISYLIFGVLTTLVDALVFFISNKVFCVEYILATVLAWILAVLFAYFTNKIWVFNSKNIKLELVIKEAFAFFIARLLSLVFTIVWMFLCVEILKLDEFIAKLLANVFVVIMNYFFSKLFIFKSR